MAGDGQFFRQNGRIVPIQEQEIKYDKNGNLLEDLTKKYTWDAQGRLTAVRKKSDNTLIAQYEYDADGRRVQSVVSGVVTKFHYDRDGIRVLYETDVNGALTVLYTYSDEKRLLSMTKPGQGTYYYHFNAHGDVMQMSDQNGAIVASYAYDAWGNIVSQTGAMAAQNPYRYAGYRFDAETGLYDLSARYYDAEVGRFLSRDDLTYLYEDIVSSHNLYTYANNNPVNQVDQTGHWAAPVAKRVTKAALKKGIKKLENNDLSWFKWVGAKNHQKLLGAKDRIVREFRRILNYDAIYAHNLENACINILIMSGIKATTARQVAPYIVKILWG